MADNDEHFLKRIEKGKATQLYVDIYGDPDAEWNKGIIRRAMQMADNRSRRNLTLQFFDAASAKVWGKWGAPPP